MIELAEAAPNVLVMTVKDKLTGGDIDTVVAKLKAMLAEFEKIGMVADLTDMEGMTAMAVVKDMAAEFRFIGQWSRFPKVAMIADRGWLEKLATTAGAVLPQVEMKTFGPGQREQAIAFVGTVECRKIAE